MSRFVSTGRLLALYLSAGALSGIAIGGLEAIALDLSGPSPDDRATLWWAPLFYALCFAPTGAIVGLLGRAILTRVGIADARSLAYRLAIAATLFVGTITALRWRLRGDHAWLANEYGRRPIDGLVLLAALALGLLGFRLVRKATLRRQWLCASAFVVLAALASSIPVEVGRSLPPSAVPPAEGPNVVLIVVDTLRADYLKLYDPSAPTHTPEIERYASDGVLFEEGVAHGTWTKPSFGSIYTGRRPREHTAIDTPQPLPEEVDTLAEILREAGYTTIGMSNCNPNNSLEMGFAQGFEYFEDLGKRGFQFGFPASARRLTLFRRTLEPMLERFLPFAVHTEHYYRRADHITEKGLEWIDERTREGRPFFLVLHYMDPHDPYMDGELSGHGYLHYYLDKHAREELVEGFVDSYAGDVDYMDAYLGSLMDGLRERNLYDDALVVLTSDHGEEFYEHGGFSHGQSVYEELVRVPLVLKLPENRGAGGRSEDLARHVDIAPTILSLAGIASPESMRGQALVSADGDLLNSKIRWAFSEANLSNRELVSVRTRTEKFIRDGSYSGEVTMRELHDLTQDPEETANLVDSDQVRADPLERAIDDFLIEAGERPEARKIELSAGAAEQLGALGYIE